jgi:hypothetical protein
MAGYGKELNYYYGSTALCWALAAFQFLDPIHNRQDSLGGGSATRKASTYIQNKRTQYIYDLSGIRTHDPSVRASEDS